MKSIGYSLLFVLAFSTTTAANAAGSMLRVTCEGEDAGAEVLINGKFRGECPIDLQVPEGPLKVLVRKKVDAQRERVFEQEIRMGEGSVKKIEVKLGAAKLNASEETRRAENSRRLEGMPFDALQREASGGNTEAMKTLAFVYFRGNNLAPKNMELAVTWFRKGAEAGDARCMYMLGLLYRTGTGLPKNPEQAFQWYRKAAALGHAEAMAALAPMYESGTGVVQNQAEAAQWYRKAADAGNVYAMVSLGTAYSVGMGVPKSNDQANEWYRKAADSKDDLANTIGMFWLGVSYERGLGVPQDEQQAIYWWKKAAEAEIPNESAVEELKKRGLSR